MRQTSTNIRALNINSSASTSLRNSQSANTLISLVACVDSQGRMYLLGCDRLVTLAELARNGFSNDLSPTIGFLNLAATLQSSRKTGAHSFLRSWSTIRTWIKNLIGNR